MGERTSIDPTIPVEILAQWEGPAIHEPGVLFEEQQQKAGRLPVEANAVELAGWIAVTALSGTAGHPAHEAIRTKVVGVLSACKQRYGQAKIAEIKQALLEHLQQSRDNRKVTDEELLKRVELLFGELHFVG